MNVPISPTLVALPTHSRQPVAPPTHPPQPRSTAAHATGGCTAILDEATNATSVDIEDRLYQAAAELGITCVTISQRPALTRYHTRELKLTDGKGDWRLCEVSSLQEAAGEEDSSSEEWGG